MSVIRDLGKLDGEVLLFGGPYSNLQATEKLLAEAGRLGIGDQNLICTGDLAAYCANPVEVSDLIAKRGIAVVAGNCEKQLASGALDCGCGFDEGTTCDLLSQGWFSFASKALAAEHRDYYAALPDRLVFRHEGRKYVVIHGGASAINLFLWPLTLEDDFWKEISLLQEEVGAIDGVISGHCGIPFRRNIDGIDWINAGAIGLSAHDGTRETNFAVLSGREVRFERLSYDWSAAQSAMQAAGLTQGYDVALKTGFWPSEEILPKSLRQASFDNG